jgi:3-methylfumaryl-CoA hydratase
MALNIKTLRECVGRSESANDQITPVPIAALSATLDREAPDPQPGYLLPPLWHWLYFLPVHRQSELGPDGHPQRGGFLPPVSLPRRMWAGGRLQFHRSLRVADRISRVSQISDITYKEGRTGALVFVTAHHEISNNQGLAVTEEQDLVFRENPKSGDLAPAPKNAPVNSQFQRMVCPDPVMLFRYSALTFNNHRIHYDRRYAMEVEGYPGLVVHGPLIATLLLDLLHRNFAEAVVTGFAYRAIRPLFDTAGFSVCGRLVTAGNTAELWAQDAGGYLAMEATATLA